MTSSPDTDVLVVGGGPVGLAAAIEARLAGLSVVVVEPRSGPVDKACGEGLMPGALAALARLGVDPAGHVLSGIGYRDDRHRVDHAFTAGPGRGVRRTTLHAALAQRARELGAVQVAARVESLRDGRDGVTAAGVHARWLLACDGLHSTVRRLTGLTEPPRHPARSARYGLRRHYEVDAWTDLVEVHWGRTAEAYVTPVGDRCVGVALLGPPSGGFDHVLTQFPALRRRLGGAAALGPVRGAGPLRQRTAARTAGHVRLVGDASGYVDALTGEGLRVGLAQAAAAVRHLDDAAAYERAWVGATRDYRLITTALLAWASSPARTAVVPAARLLPGVFPAVVDRLAR